MDAEKEQKRKTSRSSCSSMSREEPEYFSNERNTLQEETEMLGARDNESNKSMHAPLTFACDSADGRNMFAAHYPVVGPLDSYPPLIENWTKEHVKDWLIIVLKVPPNIAQSLYDQELSGACLVCFEKQDLVELGCPPAPAIQIIRQVERFKQRSEALQVVTLPKRYYEPGEGKLEGEELQDMSGARNDDVETETVSDSGIQSQSSTSALETTTERITFVIDQTTSSSTQLNPEMTDNAQFLQPKRTMCQSRPFDKSSTSIFYMQNDIFPPVSGPSNLLDPIHEYQLLPSANEASEREILFEFTKEVFTFAASCMNSRTNGTIHFGVSNMPEEGHGQVTGHNITSFTKYNEAFESCLGEYFDEQHVHAARMCIRPPNFIQVHQQDGTTSDKWVIEVDVVPTYSVLQENVFYTQLSIASTEKTQQCKTECLFVRDGPTSVNILADTNPRIVQEKIKDLVSKVKNLASARRAAEERDEQHASGGNQGQRLKQLITRGRDAFENSLQVIVVTDKCHSSQLEHLDFLKEIKLFAVLDFDPESDMNGTCSFYRRDHIANLHYPCMYTTEDSVTVVIQKLNLFQQTSWIFCNGRVNEDNEADKPMTPSEWLKKRSGDINNMVSLLCSPDLLSKDKLLVLCILHSKVTDISSPILEAFCAIYRTLEGADNMLCLCKDSTVFSHWKQLIECRCKEDITSKSIYDLTLNEISSTIKRLKEPQTQSSRRYLPSTGSSSILLAKKDEELMTVLDILCENQCEDTEIETMDSFQEFKKKTEEDFFRGGQVSWWNFYLSEMRGSLPFIKRDKYDELYDLITPTEGHTSPCVLINLFHHPGCGGTTLAMHVLWNLRRKFRCAVVKNTMATNSEIAVQVINLLTYGREEQSGFVPVLLLVDNWDDVEGLKHCILNASGQGKRQLMVIILNCERTSFPAKSATQSCIANVVITNKLSVKEQGLFADKFDQLKDYHEKPETFYAFMIMTKNFSETYITNVVSNIVNDLDLATQKGRLFSFLALLNTYVNGSYMSLSLCEELVGIRNAVWKRETLDDKMNPYSTLMIIYGVEEHGTYQAVRFLHQMIASKCVKVLTEKHSLSLAEITINLLHCDRVYKSCMGKDFLVQNIHSMLITRHRKEQGDDKNTLFSPLIEDINKEEGPNKIKEVLEKATQRFDRSATIPQALARHFYLTEKDFGSALKWALEARGKISNSYIADTVGQVYKSQLKKELEEDLTPESLDKCLHLASKAVNAFQESQELAKKDESLDVFDIRRKKIQKSYNTSGYVGETEVMIILLDAMESIPGFSFSDRYKKDKMLQFLKSGQAKSLYDSTNETFNPFVPVLANHEKFLVSLKPRLKEIFSFFENYFTYLKHRSLERETADERNKRKVSDYFKKYINVFSTSEQERASEKSNNPNLSLRQQIEDHRYYLEMKRADSFAGLLQWLNDKNCKEMEHILQKWRFIFDNSSSRSTPDTVNFILANIVLHCLKPSCKSLKKYEDLVLLLNEALQKEGTQSSLTELYYLSMLLLWPAQEQRLDRPAIGRNVNIYITSAKKSFHRRFSHMFPAKSTIAHFFLGKSTGLRRIISKVKLDQILDNSGQNTKSRNYLWQSGAAWNEPEIQKTLARIKGRSENGDIYVNYGGNQKLLVRPVYLGLRSGSSREEVSFYLGFTMEGPVAYNITYENEQ